MWNIPKELMNNNPLEESEVKSRIEEKGYRIIEFRYKNNRTRMPCYDNEGYIVMISLDSLRQNIKQYSRFSPSYNEEFFMYNLNHYRSFHLELPKVIDWKYVTIGKSHKKQVRLLCECSECKSCFYVSLYEWRTGKRNRCPKCTNYMSNLEKEVERWLKKNNVEYLFQYKTEKCRNKRKLPFDFYLPNQQIFIEIDGPQHTISNLIIRNHKITDEELKDIQYRDKIKTDFCSGNNFKLLRISYLEFENDNYIKILEKNILNQ